LYKTIKKCLNIDRFGKVIVTLLLLLFCSIQFSAIDWQQFKKIQVSQPLYFIVALILIIFNIAFEYLKWNLIVNKVNEVTSTSIRISSFFAGTATAFITPNLLGNFIGRIYYFERKYRGKIITHTLLSNGAQFISSMIGGIISILLLGNKVKVLQFFPTQLFIVFLIVLLLIYFVFDKIFNHNKKLNRISLTLQNTTLLRTKFILLSLARHLVFTTQYVCVLVSFGVNFETEIYLYVFQIFFWSTLVPSIWIGKLFIRESVALYLLSTIISSGAIIICSAFLVWCLNQVFPALVSLIFIPKKNELHVSD
jgi:Lysylphosphatidylglycerol synthase TM region